jgi:two-component system NarL family sensor kinase
MHNVVDLSHQARRVSAALMRSQLSEVRDAWHEILAERSQTGALLPGDLLTNFLDGLTHFIDEPDLAIPTRLAAEWRERVPLSVEGVATTAVALGLLAEAMRIGLSDVEDPDLPQSAFHVARATLPTFSGGFVHSLMTISGFSPSDAYWYEVSQRLTEEREQRITQLAILNEVSTALASTLSLDELYRIIYEQCGRLVDTTNFFIATIGPGPHEMVSALHYFQGVRRRDMEGPPRRMGLVQVVIDQQAPLMVDDYIAACRERGIAHSGEVDPDSHMAWVGVPIVSGSQTIGVLVVMTDRGSFTADEAKTLCAVAGQAGAAIENARLYEAQLSQARQLKAINQIARVFATMRDPHTLMHEASALIRDLFGYSVVTIFTAHPDDDRLLLRAVAGLEEAEGLKGFSISVNSRGVIGRAAAQRQPVLVNDVRLDPDYITSPVTGHILSELAVPLLRVDQLLGVLDIESPVVGAFGDADIEVISTLADQLAIALENADLFRQELRRRSELSLILEASRAANSSLVLDDVIQRVASGIADAVGLPSCVVYLFDEDRERLIPSAFVAREGSQLDTALVSQVSPSGETSQLLKQVVMASREACALEMMTCDVRDDLARVLCASALLAVPFIVKDECLGFALVVSHDAEYHFSQHQLRVAYGIAGAAALALENARLYARSHSLGMAEERIRVAREIHDGMAQGLTAISLHLEAAEHMFEKKPDKAQAKISRALELTRANLEDARRSVLDLRASALQELTVGDAIQHRLQQYLQEQPSGTVSATYNADGMYGRLSSRLELSLYRIFEEALDNIARHADATHIDISITRTDGDIQLVISDNGAGFDVDSVMSRRQPGGKFGFVAIRERVRLLHGTLQVDSASGSGTRLQVTVPFEPHRGLDVAQHPVGPDALREEGVV